MSTPACNAEELLGSLTSGALVIAIPDGTIVYANPTFLALSGFAQSDVVGKKASEFVKLPQKTETMFFASNLTTHNAEELRVKVKNSLLPSGELLSIIDRFYEDTSLTKAHSDFVSTVSHEFRTPPTSIKGFADTILSYGSNLQPEQQRRFVGIIRDQANRLIRLVENMLTVSKLGAERVQMTYRPIMLEKLIDKIVESIKAKHNPNRNFVLQVASSLPPVWADADSLEQVLLNLIDNAVKYSKDGADVRVSAKLHPEKENRIVITIQDSGIGIPEEHLNKLFTKFYRIESVLTQEVEGTGLGLYITKSLTTAMGGDIAVASEAGKGTTFTLTFPEATPQLQADYQQKQLAEEDELVLNEGDGDHV